MSINKRGFYESVGCCFCSFDPSSRAKNKLDIRFSELEGNSLWKNNKMDTVAVFLIQADADFELGYEQAYMYY